MKSIFLSKALWLFNYILNAYKASFTYSVVQKIQDVIKNILNSSFFITKLKEEDTEAIRESMFYKKILSPVFKFLPLKSLVSNSSLLKFFTLTPVLGFMWVMHIMSYGFLPTPLSLLLSLGLIVLFLCRLAFKPVNPPSTAFVLTSLFILIMLFIGGILNPLNFDTLSIMLIFGVTIFLIITYVLVIEDKKMFYITLYGLGLTILLYSLYGFYQKVVGVTVDPAWLDEGSGNVIRIYSVFKNPNVFGEFLTLTLPLMFAGMNVSKKASSKLFFFIVLMVGCLNILLSFSRGSMVSFAFGMLLLIVIRDRRYLPLFFIGLILSPIILPESIWARLLTIVQGGDSSSDYRTSIYLASADMLKDHFVVGVGLGNFKELYKMYAYTASKTFHAHNTFLMLWLELGVVGLISWLTFVFAWVKQMFTMKNRNEYTYYAVAAFAGIIGCSMQAMIEHIFHNYDIVFYFFLVIGIGYLAMKLSKEDLNA